MFNLLILLLRTTIMKMRIITFLFLFRSEIFQLLRFKRFKNFILIFKILILDFNFLLDFMVRNGVMWSYLKFTQNYCHFSNYFTLFCNPIIFFIKFWKFGGKKTLNYDNIWHWHFDLKVIRRNITLSHIILQFHSHIVDTCSGDHF